MFLAGVLILGTQIYFFLNHRKAELPISTVTPIETFNWREIPVSHPQDTPTFRPLPKVSLQPVFISKDGERMRLYTNKKYGFSFAYLAVLDITEETPERVVLGTADKIVFGTVESGMGEFAVFIEPTTFSDPYEKVDQMNKDSTDRDIREDRISKDYRISAENFHITRRIRERNISIDGYPAIVTYEVTLGLDGGETYPERMVFFIKDKHLFTISTRYEDEHLWNSFKFDK